MLSFTQLANLFESKYDIWIGKAKERKINDGSPEAKKPKYETIERSKIVSRLIDTCGDEKEEQFEHREYNLCKLIQYSFKSFDEEAHKNQVVRTIRLLENDDPIILEPLIVIGKNEVKEESALTLDFRAQLLESKELKATEAFEAEIYTVVNTDTHLNMFFKNSYNAVPQHGARILEKKELKNTINTKAVVEYIKLCHILEQNPNLLDLDLEFFSDERSLSEQIEFIILNAGDLLSIPHGIKILNAFGFRALYQEHGAANLVNFKKIITSLPNGLAILEAYHPILKFISFDFLQTHHEELFAAIGVPGKINELIFRYREIYTAFKNGDGHFIEKYISQPAILAEIKKCDKATQEEIEVLSDIIILALEKNIYRHDEWLQLIAQSQPLPVLYQFITQRYIAKYLNEYTSLEEWLIATDPKSQIELFNFLESQGKKLNYFMLYALSDVLKELPAINKVIAEHRADALQLIQTRYVLEERDEKELKINKSFFTTPPPEPVVLDEEQIERTSSELKEYQRKYLYVDPKGQASAGLASLTPSARAAAFNHIALPLQKSKEAPDEFEKKLLDEDFKKSITGKFNIRPLHFFDPLLKWAEHRKQKQAEIDQYWEARAKICRRVENNDVLLLELLLDIDVLNNLTQVELGLLFENGNKALFAEIMVLAYPGRPFTPFQSGRKQIDIQLLKQWVLSNESIPELNRVNRARFEHKIPQYIPVGAKYPGIYPGDAALSKYQLYQLQDLDIQVAEEILFEEYKGIIQPLEFYNLTEQESKGRSHYRKVLKKEVEYIGVRNQVDQKDKKQEKKAEFIPEKNEEDQIKEKLERKTEKLESNSTLKTIYLVPMNPAEAVLIDPSKEKHPHFRTYNEFKNKIRLVIDSIDFGKSGIIAGICNLNGNHYVPYFIYKDTKGQIYVLTIDPSHETSPVLKECFGDIFPHSLYADAHITQQVRQRDCGYNSLESIRVAAESLLSKKPLISIVDDVLHFDPSQLTVNGESFKGFDHQRKQMYFLREFIQQGEKVRDKWGDWLKGRNKVRYSADNISDYDYMGNIEAQEAGDNLDGVYSVIASLMIRENLLEEYRQQYIDKLELPTSQQLLKIKKRLEDLKDLPKETLDEVAADAICIVCKINFKQNTVLGLLNIFKNTFLPHCQINKDSTEASLYLEFTKTEKYVEFSKLLSAAEIVDFRKQAQHAAQEKLKDRLLLLKEKFIYQYVHVNIEEILKSIDSSSDKTIDAIIVYLADHKDTNSDVELLLVSPEVRKNLEQFIYKEVQEFTVKKAQELWHSIERNPLVLRQESIFDYKQDSIQLNVYELENALTLGLLEKKVEQLEEKSSVQHIYKVNKNASYYKLIQLVMSNKYTAELIEKITEQLHQFVNSVIYDPKNLEFVHALSSSEQIKLSMNTDFTELFLKMTKNVGYFLVFPVSGIDNSFHRVQLDVCIQTQMKTFTSNILTERFQKRYDWLQQQTTYSELLELKDEDPGQRLLMLCFQKNIIINPGETIYDFVSIYQNQYKLDENQILYSYGFIKVKLEDSKKIIDFCNEHKLFTEQQNGSINKELVDLSKRFNVLATSSLSKCYFELSCLIPEIKSFILKIAFELLNDPRYVLGSDVPGSYTYNVRHLLCSIFDMPEVNKLILTSKESRDVDLQFKLMPTIRERYYPAYHDFSQHLLGKIESKSIPKTYGRLLNWGMLIECLQYWRANHSHPHSMTSDEGLDQRYFELLKMVNDISVEDLHHPLPFDAILKLKRILSITDDFTAQFQTWILYEPKTSADLAIGAILNSNPFSPVTYPKKTQVLMPDEPLEMKHIQMLTELYFGTKEVKNLPKTTIELMNDLKLTGMHVVKGFSPINPPEYYFLENTIRAISNRHSEQKESFILDYTDVQILKKAINYYVVHFKHSRDMLNNKENTVIDSIFTVLAVLIQANTLDATPVAELLIPHVKLVPSSQRVPLSELMRASNLLVAKESAAFYQQILHEAKEICTNEQMLNISAFIDIISRFDQINPSLMSASGPVKMNAQFKKCVENARTANRLKDLLIMIAEKDMPMSEMLDQVLSWSEMLNSQHVQEVAGLFLMA